LRYLTERPLEHAQTMSDDPKAWVNRPMYATWPGRLVFLVFLVLSDLGRTLYPEIRIDSQVLALPQRGGGRAEIIEPGIAVPLSDTHGQFDGSDGLIGDVWHVQDVQ
jgi:hypothetical protein